jgi:hypothetical protein
MVGNEKGVLDMWVKAENGKLLNLAHAQVVEVYSAKEGECSVIVRFAGTGLTDSNSQPTSSDILVTELTAPKSQKDADKVLDRIGHSLERKEAFTDLTRPGS